MKIHFILMAAGNSRRFGSNKLLLEFQGKPLYQHGLDTLLSLLSRNTEYTLTVVSQYEEILQGARERIEAFDSRKMFDSMEAPKRMVVVQSPLSSLGVSYTMKAGINSLLERYGRSGQADPSDFFVFMVADQPYLREQTLQKLADTASFQQTKGVSLCYGEEVGNPCLFAADCLPELLALEGDQGGRRVLKRYSCSYVEAESEMELWDVDYKEDISTCS